MRERLSHPLLRGLIAIMGAAFVHSLMPIGVFGRHDIVFRALLTGATAGLIMLAFWAAAPTKTSP
jgi:hypothetical protein